LIAAAVDESPDNRPYDRGAQHSDPYRYVSKGNDYYPSPQQCEQSEKS
jgi:hypothetical protein